MGEDEAALNRDYGRHAEEPPLLAEGSGRARDRHQPSCNHAWHPDTAVLHRPPTDCRQQRPVGHFSSLFLTSVIVMSSEGFVFVRVFV
jgi:hypothetical protein